MSTSPSPLTPPEPRPQSQTQTQGPVSVPGVPSAPSPAPATAAAPTTPAGAAAPGAPAGQPPVPAVAPEGVALISIDDFFKIKLVTAEVVAAEAVPKADRLLKLQCKVGTEIKQIVSGIRQWYSPEQMIGKTIVIVNNLQPTKLRGVDSFGMLLAVTIPEGGLRLITTDGPATSGLPVK